MATDRNLRCPHCGSAFEDVVRSTVDGKLYASCGCIVSAEVRTVILMDDQSMEGVD